MNSGAWPARLVVLVSGSGTNLQALIDAIAGGKLDANITLVLSNRRTAYGLIRAKVAGIPTRYFPLKPFKASGQGRIAYDAALAAEISPFRPDLVVLAGWMHILSPAFLEKFPGKVINLHPALPGEFDGTYAIERAFAAYKRGDITHSGCMVHYAIPKVDAGAVVAQRKVPIFPGDTLDDFAARMHQHEHELIVESVRMALESREHESK